MKNFWFFADHNKVCSDHDRGGCSHRCENVTDSLATDAAPRGYICACFPGYIIAEDNHKQCEDIDECAKGLHYCSQICTNMNGTYACSCREGFKLIDNLSGVCRAENSDLKVLFGTGTEIRALSIHKNEELPVIANEKRVYDIDFNPKMEYIYWIDSHDNAIKRSYMLNAKDGMAKIGHAQDINIKGTFSFNIIDDMK